MSRYLIVPERSRIDLTARPGLPGLRLVIDEVSGTVDTGAPAGDRAASGEMTVWLQAVIDDDVRAAGVPDWLRHGELVAVTGQLLSLRRLDGDRLEVQTRFRIADRVVPFSGAGRVARLRGPDAGMATDTGGEIEAVGVTLVDPRTLGFGLPPLVTYAIHTRWRLVLAPLP